MPRRPALLPFVALLLVARTALADPHVSDEISLDSPVDSAGPGPVYLGASAQGGGMWLVAWYDSREGYTRTALYAARVSSAGTLLDPGGIRVAGSTTLGTSNPGDSVTVAYDGTQFVVVWSDTRTDAADLYAARITVGGSNLDPGGKPLVSRSGAQMGPALASSGIQLLLTWTDSSGTTPGNVQGTTWVQRVDSTTLATVGTAINAAGGLSSTSGSRAVWNGTSWVIGFLAWPAASSGSNALDVVRVDTNGALLDATPRAISSGMPSSFGPFALASDGQVTVVAYSADPTGTDPHVRAARLGSDGSPLTPSPVDLAHPGTGWASVLGVGLAGGAFEISWSNPTSSTYAADGGIIAAAAAATTVQRLNSDGSIPTPSSFALSSSNDVGDVATGSQSLLAIRGGAGSNALTFQRFSPSGTALDVTPVALNVASNIELAPRAAWNGKRYYASWLDQRSGTPRVYGTIVSPDGTVPSSTATALVSADSSQAQLFLTGGASTFVALWKDSPTGSILAARIDDTGSVLDPAGIQIASDALGGADGGWGDTNTPTSLTFDGMQFLGGYGVSFQDGSSKGLFSIALDGGVGQIPYMHMPSGPAGWDSPNVQVAATASSSLAEWDWGGSATRGLAGAASSFVFMTLGATAGTPTVQLSFENRSGHYATVDSIASDGSTYLLVFADTASLSASWDELWVWRFDASGAPATAMPTRVATVSTGFSMAQLVFDGKNYLLVWDPEDGTGQRDVVGLQLARDGSPMNTSPFVIAGASLSETLPSVASDGAGHALVTYDRFDPSSTFGSTRAWARLVDLTSTPSLDGSTDSPTEASDASADGLAGTQDAARDGGDAGLPRGEVQVSVSGGCSLSAAPAGGAPAGWVAGIAALALRQRRSRRLLDDARRLR